VASREIVRAGDRTRTGDVQLGKLAFYQLNYARGYTGDACKLLERRRRSQGPRPAGPCPTAEPAVGIEPTTARLRIGCSATELRWRPNAEGRNDATPAAGLRVSCCTTCPGADSNRDALRHHPLKMACLPISPPGHCLTTAERQGAYASPTGLTGIEPATSGVTDRHSNQLSYSPNCGGRRSEVGGRPLTVESARASPCSNSRASLRPIPLSMQ
jgi:hypothetical protein